MEFTSYILEHIHFKMLNLGFGELTIAKTTSYNLFHVTIMRNFDILMIHLASIKGSVA
jgi:hypothetical protein